MSSKIAILGDEKSLTPRQTLLEALNNSEELKVVAVVGLRKDDRVLTGWSAGGTVELLGCLSILEQQLADASQD